MRRALVALAFFAVLAAAPTAPAAQSPSSPAGATPPERAVLAAINEARGQAGLRRLRLDPALQTGAHEYARSLLARDLFVHSGLPGIAETLAFGSEGVMDPRGIVQLWLASPPHRELLLLHGARRAGVGLAFGRFQGLDRTRLAVARIAP